MEMGVHARPTPLVGQVAKTSPHRIEFDIAYGSQQMRFVHDT